MTREEKVNLLNTLLEIEEKNDIGNLTRTDRREFQQWVEDLEQDPIDVLDKIRAEIKTKYDSIPWRNNDYDDGWVEALEWVLDNVIDKYRK